MVKIGMTRRLDPMDRVREPGDPSVPFHYDVHAIVFSVDELLSLVLAVRAEALVAGLLACGAKRERRAGLARFLSRVLLRASVALRGLPPVARPAPRR